MRRSISNAKRAESLLIKSFEGGEDRLFLRDRAKRDLPEAWYQVNLEKNGAFANSAKKYFGVRLMAGFMDKLYIEMMVVNDDTFFALQFWY